MKSVDRHPAGPSPDKIPNAWPLSLPPVLGLAAGSFMISFSAVFVKLAHVGPMGSAFYRVFFGGMALLAIALVSRSKFTRSSWALQAGCGLVFALDLAFWHTSIHSIGPGLSTVLANFQVFVLAGIGVFFFGERVTGRFLLSIVLALAGILLLVGPGWAKVSTAWKLGVFFGLATALAYSLYLLLLRRLQSVDGLGELIWNLALVSLWTALFLIPVVLMSSESLLIPDNASLAALVAYGLVGQVAGWMLISRNLPRVRVSTAGLVILLQPTLAFAWDMLLFGRPTTALDLAGASLAIGAIYLGVTRRTPPGKPGTPPKDPI
jgi:drug/metabolite transporter (DMT)-like permease